ncbi:hypothetical protein [Dactylosporangium darangshiense]|uniref:hypothetical protein n=1 Tax=Dactylosporangium darangshiense TaxID=579108 RepID=UPI003639A6E3
MPAPVLLLGRGRPVDAGDGERRGRPEGQVDLPGRGVARHREREADRVAGAEAEPGGGALAEDHLAGAEQAPPGQQGEVRADVLAVGDPAGVARLGLDADGRELGGVHLSEPRHQQRAGDAGDVDGARVAIPHDGLERDGSLPRRGLRDLAVHHGPVDRAQVRGHGHGRAHHDEREQRQRRRLAAAGAQHREHQRDHRPPSCCSRRRWRTR